MLHPSDVYVLAGLVAFADDDWTFRSLADKLELPHATVQRGFARGAQANLFLAERRGVHLPNFEEFLVHGVRFLAPASLGSIVPGVPAAWAASPMAELISESADALPPVWPNAQGRVRGQALEPLHPSAMSSSEGFPKLGELLAIIDCLRIGDVRVRSVAADAVARTLRESMVRRA
jgi:hypothetical protein